MCLSKVDAKPTTKNGTGWKSFGKRGGRLRTLFKGSLTKPIPIGVWIKSEDYGESKRILAEDGAFYRAGFHLFVNEGDTYHVSFDQPRRQVEYREVVATGTEGYMFPRRVVVAREIRVLRKRRAKKCD